MLAHTKKPPTESITICLTGPVCKKEELLNKIADTGFSVLEDVPSVPWREALNMSEQDLPGTFLAGARFRESMTQEQLAAATGIPRRHISEMENNKRPIGKKNARKLAEALHVDPRVFLSA
jgi:DNA-binding XRE family transcriptional regulator